MSHLSLVSSRPVVRQALPFFISSVVARTHDNSYGGYPWVIEVVVTLPVKLWTKYRNSKALGQLYGIEICNAVYAISRHIPAHNPTVSDTAKAKAGVKTIRLSYYLNDGGRAKALGLTVRQDSSGSVYGAFNESVTIRRSA